MKLPRSLAITSILQSVFCLICIASGVCFGICRYTGNRSFFDAGNALVPYWMLNPIAFPCFAVNLYCFLSERHEPGFNDRIGRRWVWVFLWPVITTVMYLAAMILLVAFTGGV